MSETNNNPNSVKFSKRAKVAGAIAAVTGLLFGAHAAADQVKDRQEQTQLEQNLQRPDALQEYLKGDQIPHDKAVRLEAPDDMSPNAFAKEIKKDNDSQWELTQQIKPQADAQMDPGLQGGEQVVVEKSLVDPDAIKEFGVEDLNDPNRQDPAMEGGTGLVNTGKNPETGEIEQLPQSVVPEENGFNPNTPR